MSNKSISGEWKRNKNNTTYHYVKDHSVYGERSLCGLKGPDRFIWAPSIESGIFVGASKCETCERVLESRFKEKLKQ